MGWKGRQKTALNNNLILSQSAFAGYGLKRRPKPCRGRYIGSRNPLSLDMGWKVLSKSGHRYQSLSQSAFAGYGLKRMEQKVNDINKSVAIRFRWIWVEKDVWHIYSCTGEVSQSAFAGYGLKRIEAGWTTVQSDECRNPLSLDMGWKGMKLKTVKTLIKSQSAFAGYGLKSRFWILFGKLFGVAIRFRWIWVEKQYQISVQTLNYVSQSAFAGYGLKRWILYACSALNASRNPLSLDMGWKVRHVSVRPSICACRNPLSLDMGWKVR